jgi:hypothetical protein
VRVQTVWPGGVVELPDIELTGDPLVGQAPADPVREAPPGPTGLAAVILGLARAAKGNGRET